MEWNPKTYDFCYGCGHYESVSTYVDQWSNPAKRRCKHLARCSRVAEFVEKKELGIQMSIWGQAAKKEG